MHRSEQRGFTLVEVMVALVIIGVAMVTLLATQVGSIRSYADAKVITVCSLLADKKMAELESGEYPEPGEQEGVFEDNEHYSWSLYVNETDLEQLREVTLEVSLAPREGFEEDGGLAAVTIQTYIADPGEEEDEEEEGDEEVSG